MRGFFVSWLLAGAVASAAAAPGPAAGAVEEVLSAPGARVAAARLAVDRAGRPVAAVWSEPAAERSALMAAFATPEGQFSPPRVVLRTTSPVTALGTAVTPTGVAIVAGTADAVFGLTAAPAGTGPVRRLSRAAVVGQPPGVASDDLGNVLAVWRRQDRVLVSRAAAGRWRAARRLRGVDGRPAVAAAPRGVPAVLVRRGRRRVQLIRAPAGKWLASPRTIHVGDGRLVCCGLAARGEETLVGTWADSDGSGRSRVHVATEEPGGRFSSATSRRVGGTVSEPPVVAGAPGDGSWLVGWWMAGGQARLVRSSRDGGQRFELLPAQRYAPLASLAVAPGGAVAALGSYLGGSQVMAGAAAGAPLTAVFDIDGDPAGVALTGAGPLALVVRWGDQGDSVIVARP